MTELSPAKARFMVGLWFFAGLMWLVFGLLYWFRIHQHFFAAAYFVLSAFSFWLCFRLNRKRSR